MVTEKQRRWRKIFGERYGKKKGTKTHKRGVSMARFRRSRRRGGSGMNSMIKAAAIGAIAGALAPRIPFLNTLPTFVTGAGAAYMLGGKSIKNAVIGGASAQFLSPSLSGALSTVTGQSNSTAW